MASPHMEEAQQYGIMVDDWGKKNQTIANDLHVAVRSLASCPRSGAPFDVFKERVGCEDVVLRAIAEAEMSLKVARSLAKRFRGKPPLKHKECAVWWAAHKKRKKIDAEVERKLPS